MLLAIDVGNTQTVFGLFEGAELREQFRVGTDRTHTGDELAVLLRSFVDLETLDGIVLCSSVPLLVREYEAFAERWAGTEVLVVGPWRLDRDADPLRRPARGRPRPDRERRRGARAARRAVRRRRLRHVDELRRRQRGGRVRRRRARAGDRGVDGRALRARRAAAEGAVRRAGARDQPDDDRRAPVGARLRLRGPGRRDRRPDPRRARRARRAGRRDGRPGRPDRAALEHDHRRRPGADPAGPAPGLGAEPAGADGRPSDPVRLARQLDRRVVRRRRPEPGLAGRDQPGECARKPQDDSVLSRRRRSRSAASPRGLRPADPVPRRAAARR